MKSSSSYKTRISIGQLLDNPDAYLVYDVLSNTGTSVLIPSRVPIGKLTEGLDKPDKLIDTLDRMGIRKVEIMAPQEIDYEEMMDRLKELDPSVVIVDNAITNKAHLVIDDLFNQASLEAKFNIPIDVVNEIGHEISEEIMKTSQIALSMIAADIDSYTKDHALNVSMLAGYIAKKLADANKAPQDLIEKSVQAGLLFDIGKTAIPPEILNKQGRLDPEEMVIMRNHAHESVSICRASGIKDKDVLEGIASHHERYDGSGYNRGLVGTQIPLIGRILAVADTFDAMTSPRVYKNAVSSKMSFNFIMSANETEFDPDICKIFISGMGVYPPGTIVELSNGDIATVAAVTNGNLLQPKVTLKRGGEQKVIDLAAERLYIRRSMDTDTRESADIPAL
ncbi:MAG: HD-GYP domain-containing protein [Synergistaceae bacterium]|jgi:HD-GYP domain-containing protein (c-di-GMP phosphodiesterase class II)|nr:HD-GYP domain-containing protein [Synergistaceae bacterium]